MDNVYKTVEIIHYCRSSGTNSTVVLSLDIGKAFDQVKIKNLLSLLEHMAFGPRFWTALQAIYNSPTAAVKINRAISQPFNISRSTRQGCPLSPLLFALTIEPLAEALRLSEKYRGVQTGQQHHKMSLFANNMILFISDLITSIQEIERILKHFQYVSGLNVNKEKSLLYPFVIDKPEQSQLQQQYIYAWVKASWKYLGV